MVVYYYQVNSLQGRQEVGKANYYQRFSAFRAKSLLTAPLKLQLYSTNIAYLKKLIKSLHVIFLNILFLLVLKLNAKGNC